MAQNWTCPFCNRAQTVTKGQTATRHIVFELDAHKFENLAVDLAAQACANEGCQEVSVVANLWSGSERHWSNGEPILAGIRRPISSHWLRPESSARPQPSYIPQPLREDYEEACKIRDLSPKASATLSRRCIQGMIRDFCGISKGRSIDEIVELRSRLDSGSAPQGVTEETVEAIDHIRSVGNIGAHMEKDINLIVPVDANEAQSLIELIELLFDEWYVARNRRQERLASVKAIATEKAAIKSTKPVSSDTAG